MNGADHEKGHGCSSSGRERVNGSFSVDFSAVSLFMCFLLLFSPGWLMFQNVPLYVSTGRCVNTLCSCDLVRVDGVVVFT